MYVDNVLNMLNQLFNSPALLVQLSMHTITDYYHIKQYCQYLQCFYCVKY